MLRDTFAMSTAVYTPEGCVPLGKAVVFDAHREYDREGKLIREFTRDDLQEICNINNDLVENRGHFSPIGPGHNILPERGERVPQALYPPIWGWAGQYRVEGHPKDPTLSCIVVDTYAKTTREPDGNGKMVDPATEIKRYPFPSVEIHQTDGDGRQIAGRIGRIACLREDPRRDLGPMLCYSNASGVHPGVKTRPIYADPSRITRLAAHERGSVLFYAMETPNMFPDTDMPNDPAADPSVEKPSQGLIDAIIEALKVQFPDVFAAPPPPPMDAPGGDPAGPGGLDLPGGSPPMPAPAMFSKSSKAAPVNPRTAKNVATFEAATIASLQAEIEALKKVNTDKALQYQKDDAEMRADRLEAIEGKKINRDRVVLRFQKMATKEEKDEYERELIETSADVSQYSKRLPPTEFIDTRGPQRRPTNGGGMTEADLDARLAKMRASGETDFNKVAN